MDICVLNMMFSLDIKVIHMYYTSSIYQANTKWIEVK